jgi:N-acetyl-gamma-glutamyl-phosphate reductase
MTAVFIDGAHGTTGLEIRDRLAGRPELDLVVLPEERRRDADARAEALNGADIVVLCLPDAAAREALALIANDRVRVIDASSGHRVAAGWTYGFPELEADAPERIAASARVSNPGCYPTGFLALVRPLVRVGLIPVDWPVSVNAVSGYSGGGKAMIAEYEGTSPAPAWRGYAYAMGHKHVPEMTVHAGLSRAPLFAPAVVDTYRGMVVEVPLQLEALPLRPSPDAVRSVLAEAYHGCPLVTVDAGEAATVSVEELAGTDRLTLRVLGDAAQVRLVATLDNLGKGAAGAAVQNLNIMAGLDPLAGLAL